MTGLTDTIAAVSTPRGKGGVALIRISGPDAAEIGRKIFIPRGKHPDERPRYAVLG
ncbi:MAG: tRNA uridine-5-carboxymethylaminomethyl(34) synthesis GTPase MnmE, partial [Clostridia bacterium]|nr:tRNA uridine-5-carboxymethylaminomethyl(34) synthesis GTPase MnmE [Clostridia bacterium]